MQHSLQENMPPLFGVVKELQPGKSKIALELRLIRSYDVLRFNSKIPLSLECVFHDKEGNRVHATVNQSSITIMKPWLNEGNVYAVKDFVTTNNTMKFRTTDCKYKMLLFRQTHVVEVEDDSFPNLKYNFMSYSEVAKHDVQNPILFDIIGVIVSSYQPVIKDHNGKATQLMEIVVEDLEGRTLSCTLWEEYAEKMFHYLSDEPKTPICVILQFCRPTIFKGEVRITSCYNVTNIITDENVAEIKQMKEDWGRIKKDKDISLKLMKIPSYRTIEDELNDGISMLKMISELGDGKAGMFWIYGTIFAVETLGAWAYLSCKQCSKKLKVDDDSFFCESCESFDVEGRLRYKLRVCVADDSGSASFTLWDRECLQLIGKTATELSRAYETTDLPFEIDAMAGKTALFKIVIKPGETKMFDNAYAVSKINCDPHMIEKYCGPHVKNGQPGTKEGEGSSNAHSVTTAIYLSEDEPMKKKMDDDNRGPTIVKKKSKRIVIKQEKP